LPYPLLSDWFKKTARDYGVLNEENQTAKRSVFLVDKEGILRYKNTEFDANDRNQYLDVFSHCKHLCV
jgi:alkyl hydroperoxide reductase subunit AhpC